MSIYFKYQTDDRTKFDDYLDEVEARRQAVEEYICNDQQRTNSAYRPDQLASLRYINIRPFETALVDHVQNMLDEGTLTLAEFYHAIRKRRAEEENKP